MGETNKSEFQAINGKLIATAYDTDFIKRCGEILVEAFTDHLDDLDHSRLPVQRWNDPESNISDAKSWLQAGPAPSDVADDQLDGLAETFRKLVQHSLSRGQNLHHRNYVGHQVPASMPMAGLFDAITTLTNQVQGVYEMGPWGVSAERAVLDEIAAIIGFDSQQVGGLVTSGGSLANLTALLAARNEALPQFWQSGSASDGRATAGQRPVLVVHGEAHYCISRAAGVMGLGTDQVIRVPTNKDRQMDPRELDRILHHLRSDKTPIVAVVAVSCTTPTGAFDDLESISTICRSHGVWLHVDAAHGGAVCFSRRHRHLITGLHRADSVVVDAHKMMFLPAACAMVFYRDRKHRFSAFQQSAPYLFDPSAPELAEYDNAVVTLECTKRASALGLWGVWSMFGPALFETLVDHVIGVTKRFHELIIEHDSFQALAPPVCNIIAYRYLPADHTTSADPEWIDRLQLGIRRRLLERGDAYVTQTRVDERIYLRSTIMNPLTGDQDLKNVLAAIDSAGRTLIAEPAFAST